MLIQFGQIKEAEYFFEKSPKKTVVTYAIMMKG